MGAKGKVDQAIVDEVLSQPFFVHDIPETTRRETFGDRTGEDICERKLKTGATPKTVLQPSHESPPNHSSCTIANTDPSS